MKRLRLMGTLAGTVFLAACVVGPDYRRPATQIPATFRDAPPTTPQEAASVADLSRPGAAKPDPHRARKEL
jgi:outer membrane protein TolC